MSQFLLAYTTMLFLERMEANGNITITTTLIFYFIFLTISLLAILGYPLWVNSDWLAIGGAWGGLTSLIIDKWREGDE